MTQQNWHFSIVPFASPEKAQCLHHHGTTISNATQKNTKIVYMLMGIYRDISPLGYLINGMQRKTNLFFLEVKTKEEDKLTRFIKLMKC